MTGVSTSLRRDGRQYRFKVVSSRPVPSIRNVTDAEIRNGRLVLFFSDGTEDDTGLVGTTIVGTIPDNAIVSRITGQLLLSPVSGDQLVGGQQP